MGYTANMTPKTKIRLARNLRHNQTEAEQHLWQHVRSRRLSGYKFRRQVPIGTYIVDFVCEDAKLIIELDGGQHDDNKQADDIRTKNLEDFGYHVIRFWNNAVLENMDGVLMVLLQALERTRG
ncbi:MAG: endonuclease domain-containing protein [Robiginitomaculum sp.]|nr:endonuclease domain-containing protein [Robiginitomaculum sp.]MDQ7078201.1 endonuclease domain-containing protein [Robiginitomaculum sp.]